jgi:hypothetical protein
MNIINRLKYAFTRKAAWVFVPLFLIGSFVPPVGSVSATSTTIPNAGFEDGALTGWSIGTQTGNLGASINGNGTGVTVFNGSRLFSHGAHGSMGSPTVNGQPNPYYAPAVAAGTWTFSPKGGTYAVALQPKSQQTFSQATAALGLSGTQTSAITTMLGQQAVASGFGNGTPTDAAWITREVQLTAGVTYTMSWNYMATDYIPFNDGSITSLVPVTVTGTPVITVNNFVQSYALLGFTNPGTGDYSTNSYGSTGWQTSTYEVSITGTYKMGFVAFNLDDTALSPVLMVDDEIGTTLSCNQAGGSCVTFGGVEPNNETAPTLAPTVPPTTTTTVAQTTTTTTTEPPTTTTTVAPYLNAVTNLTAVANSDGSVDLDWDASAASNCVIYGYSVSFYDLTVIGGVQSGGWGVWTNQGTNYSLSTGMFSGSNPVTTGYGPVRFGIKAMTGGCAGVGTDSCTYGPEVTVDATVLDPTTTSSTTTTTTSTTVAPAVVTPPGDTTVPLPQLPEPETESTTVTLPEETETQTTLPEIVIPPVGTEPETVVVINPPDDVTLPGAGEAISTGELAGILDNAFTPDASAEEMTAVLDGLLDADLTPKQFDAVVDATLGSLEEPGADVGAVINSFLEADLSDKEFTKVLDAVFSEDVSSEVFTEALTTMLGADLSDKELDKVLDAAFSETTSPDAMVSALGAIFDGPASDADVAKVMDAVFDKDISVADAGAVLSDLLSGDLTGENLAAVFDSVFDGDLSAGDTVALAGEVLSQPLSAEEFNTVINAIFDEKVSDEILVGTFSAILDTELSVEKFAEVVNVLENANITNDQVSQVVDLITGQEGGIDPGQSAALSASPKVLESITPDQATEVFAALDVTSVTPEQEAQLAEALTNAPQDIKEALEQEVDIYGEGFDDYVAVGSQVDVGSRRTLIAATTAVAGVVGAAATGGPSGGSTGGSGGGSGGSGSTNTEGRSRREEEGQEAAGEIAGPEEDENGKFTRNSIFKYKEGTMERKFSPWGFIKKFAKETAALSFTLAGSVVVFITLSGDTRKIAIIATGVALAVHYTHQMLQNDED